MKTNIKTIGLLFIATILIISCSPSPNPLPAPAACITTGTDFQQMYSNAAALPNHSNVVFYDTEIHSYTFNLAVTKTVCSVGYQSQPAIASTPYVIAGWLW